MRLWRLGSGHYPLWSGEGARLKGGRWNQKGIPAIYAAASYAAGVLEVMVHANIGRVPRGFHFIAIDVPDDMRIDRLGPEALDGWDANPPLASIRYGTTWLRAGAAPILMVPSAVTCGFDETAVINPLHPDFGRIIAAGEQPVRLDPRLFPVRT